jgi:hypothetical protein
LERAGDGSGTALPEVAVDATSFRSVAESPPAPRLLVETIARLCREQSQYPTANWYSTTSRQSYMYLIIRYNSVRLDLRDQPEADPGRHAPENIRPEALLVVVKFRRGGRRTFRKGTPQT